ncbi:hypothetical protein ABZ876_12095 [Streptomyces sp. NPDC046931]|uniref:hypothetical protein n=1 Tax=Streptomyces sp. NPDC046931 TaxID=3154806 RepID=UPI0033DB1D3D
MAEGVSRAARQDLEDRAAASTREEWSESVDRMHAVQRIAESQGYDLDGPVKVRLFGEDYTIR